MNLPESFWTKAGLERNTLKTKIVVTCSCSTRSRAHTATRPNDPSSAPITCLGFSWKLPFRGSFWVVEFSEFCSRSLRALTSLLPLLRRGSQLSVFFTLGYYQPVLFKDSTVMPDSCVIQLQQLRHLLGVSRLLFDCLEHLEPRITPVLPAKSHHSSRSNASMRYIHPFIPAP